MPEPVGPGDEEQPAGPVEQLPDRLGEADLLEGEELVRDQAHDDARRCPSARKQRDAEAGLVARRRSRSRVAPHLLELVAASAAGAISSIIAIVSSAVSDVVQVRRSRRSVRGAGSRGGRPTGEVEVGGVLARSRRSSEAVDVFTAGARAFGPELDPVPCGHQFLRR